MPGKSFQLSLMFAGKAGANLVLHSRIDSWSFPQTSDSAGRA